MGKLEGHVQKTLYMKTELDKRLERAALREGRAAYLIVEEALERYLKPAKPNTPKKR